jgi:hypothetical protein
VSFEALLEKDEGQQFPNPETHVYNPAFPSYMDKSFLRKTLLQWGRVMFPWQENVLRDCMAIDPADGCLAYRVVGLTVPRQNGKTEIILNRILLGCVVLKEDQLYTAHRGDSARKIYLRLKHDIQSNKNLAKYFPYVKSIKGRSDKEEHLEIVAYKPGTNIKLGSCVFMTRGGNDLGRAMSLSVVYYDEAQSLTEAQDSALSSTILTRTNGQIYYIGTATPLDRSGDGKKTTDSGGAGRWFLEKRDEIISGRAKFACWNEWGTSKLTDRDDIQQIYASNPSIGFKMKDGVAITVKSVQSAAGSDEVWCTENLGYWPTQAKGTVIDITRWNELTLSGISEISGNAIMGLAIKTTPGNGSSGGRVDVVLSVRTPETTYLDLINSVDMSEAWIEKLWRIVQPHIRNRAVKSVIIDGLDGIPAILEKLVKEGLWNPRGNPRSQRNISIAQTMDITQACSAIVSSITEKSISPIKNEPLDAAVEDAGKRKIGSSGGFGFTSISGKVDVNYLETAALALHAVMRHKLATNETVSETAPKTNSVWSKGKTKRLTGTVIRGA